MASLPYWQVNVPPDQRAHDCPDYLVNIRPWAKVTLAIPDHDFVRMQWPHVVQLIRHNRLDAFRRVPSELRRYYVWRQGIEHSYDSITDYVLQHRIGWERGYCANGLPFDDPTDMKILYNDWPYGLDRDVVHLVVWTKFKLDDDEMTGHAAEGTRLKIEAYVDRVFRSRLPPDSVQWFRNWTALKSIGGVEHFHVLLNRPDPGIVAELTGNDSCLMHELNDARA